MLQLHKYRPSFAIAALAAALAGCGMGPAATGSFDRTLDVTGPVRIEISNASGAIRVTPAADGKVHVHGDVSTHKLLFGNPEETLKDLTSNPPIEQRNGTIRIGKDVMRVGNTSIDYTIEVPHQTEIEASIASGSAVIRGIQGPVKLDSASGSVSVRDVEKSVQISTASGTVDASNLGDDLRISSASGNAVVANVKGEVRAHVVSGGVRVDGPGGRVDAGTTSGPVTIRGAAADVSASSISGEVSVQGNPGGNGYWRLKTTSGNVTLIVPGQAAFHLTAEATSGDIRTQIPIVVEEQSKHSLRARTATGSGGASIEVRTVSGSIDVRPGS